MNGSAREDTDDPVGSGAHAAPAAYSKARSRSSAFFAHSCWSL